MTRAASGDPPAALVVARQRLARRYKPPKALVMTYSKPSHPALSDRTFFDGVDAVLVVRLHATHRARQLRRALGGRGRIDLCPPAR
jgi:hypothetical protein